MINRGTVFVLHCFVLPCMPIKMEKICLLDFSYSTIVYLIFLFLTLPCRVLTYNL